MGYLLFMDQNSNKNLENQKLSRAIEIIIGFVLMKIQRFEVYK